MMGQNWKSMSNVRTIAQDHMNYRHLDIAITVSSMIYYLGYM